MIDPSDNLIIPLVSKTSNFLSLSKTGLEKESLRISEKSISPLDHPKDLGSALCNRFITTDFSEALLEFITPPFSQNKDTLRFLEEIHQFVSENIGNEVLWPLSFPPFIENEDDIRIAKYGISNTALFKSLYREGLAYRYGKLMQSISGIHFNYSFANELWESELFTDSNLDQKDLKSLIYFRMLRNLERINWLILYLFGSSPIVSKNFIKEIDEDYLQKNNDCYFPYATSLRMSNLGYQNTKQAGIYVSNNSLHEYVEDLKRLTELPSDNFKENSKDSLEISQQISSNVLQIEAEYYASYRPKTVKAGNRRLTSSLLRNGVDYLEVRSLDINPFSSIGIDIETMDLLEIILIYCAFSESPMLTSDEIKANRSNSLTVSKIGRKPGLKIFNKKKQLSLEDWGLEILESMAPIASYLGKENVLDNAKEKIKHPELTLSATLLSRYMEEKLSIDELGLKISFENKKHFSKNRLKQDRDTFFKKEAIKSMSLQDNLELDQKESFNMFVERYFKS